MARFAFDRRMGADQRESVHVTPNGLDRNLPAAVRVAFRAVGSELAAMNISVAVGAVLPDVGKDRPQVALRAVNLFVCGAKGVPRAVVVEFRNGPNRGPTCVGVAVFARNGKWAVGTAAGLLLCVRRAGEGKRKKQKRQPRADVKPP